MLSFTFLSLVNEPSDQQHRSDTSRGEAGHLDTDKLEVQMKRVSLDLPLCWSVEQPSWIMRSGMLGFLPFSESQSGHLGALHLKFPPGKLGKSDFRVWAERSIVSSRVTTGGRVCVSMNERL